MSSPWTALDANINELSSRHRVSAVASALEEVDVETAQDLMHAVHMDMPCLSLDLTALSDFSLLGDVQDAADLMFGRDSVIEIQGPAASGKTNLIQQLVACCVLPDPNQLGVTGRSIEDWNKGVVVLDTAHHWNMTELRNMISKRAAKYSNDTRVAEGLVSAAVNRVHLFRPTSYTSMAATLLNLPSYHGEYMRQLEITLLVVDSISTFYWEDRLASELKKNVVSDTPTGLSLALSTLQSLRQSHQPITILSNWGLISDPENPHLFKQHLNPFHAPFDNPSRNLTNPNLPSITHHITLSASKTLSGDRPSWIGSTGVLALLRRPGPEHAKHFSFQTLM